MCLLAVDWLLFSCFTFSVSCMCSCWFAASGLLRLLLVIVAMDSGCHPMAYIHVYIYIYIYMVYGICISGIGILVEGVLATAQEDPPDGLWDVWVLDSTDNSTIIVYWGSRNTLLCIRGRPVSTGYTYIIFTCTKVGCNIFVGRGHVRRHVDAVVGLQRRLLSLVVFSRCYYYAITISMYIYI